MPLLNDTLMSERIEAVYRHQFVRIVKRGKYHIMNNDVIVKTCRSFCVPVENVSIDKTSEIHPKLVCKNCLKSKDTYFKI